MSDRFRHRVAFALAMLLAMGGVTLAAIPARAADRGISVTISMRFMGFTGVVIDVEAGKPETPMRLTVEGALNGEVFGYGVVTFGGSAPYVHAQDLSLRACASELPELGEDEQPPQCHTKWLFAPVIAADADGDLAAELVVLRHDPGGGPNQWWFRRSDGSGDHWVELFGAAGQKPVGGDYDGDGRMDIAMFAPVGRVAQWWIRPSSGKRIPPVQFGLATDTPVPCDYDGDGRTDQAVFRASSGQWWVLRSSDGQTFSVPFGTSPDTPAPGDYDGDGECDYAVYRAPGEWYILQSSNLQVRHEWFGADGDRMVAADYDNDNRFDLATFRPASGTWHVRLSRFFDRYEVTAWGLATDLAVPADYDGDGKADFSVYRDGVWWILGSRTGRQVIQFGLPTDLPIPAMS